MVEANVVANGMTGRVRCIEAAGFEHPGIAAQAPYDLVFANILMAPLLDLAEPMARHSAADGVMILSGILTGQADDVLAVYADAGFVPSRRADIGGWSALTLVRT